MTHAVRGFLLTTCLAVFSAGSALAQTTSDEAVSTTATAPPVAYVYVGTGNGINLYYAAPDGKLTLASGSPFHVIGSL